MNSVSLPARRALPHFGRCGRQRCKENVHMLLLIVRKFRRGSGAVQATSGACTPRDGTGIPRRGAAAASVAGARAKAKATATTAPRGPRSVCAHPAETARTLDATPSLPPAPRCPLHVALAACVRAACLRLPPNLFPSPPRLSSSLPPSPPLSLALLTGEDDAAYASRGTRRAAWTPAESTVTKSRTMGPERHHSGRGGGETADTLALHLERVLSIGDAPAAPREKPHARVGLRGHPHHRRAPLGKCLAVGIASLPLFCLFLCARSPGARVVARES